MIPLVIAGAVIMAIARVGGSFYGITDIWDAKYADSANGIISLLHSLDGFGGLALGMMFPVIAAFIAYSISDKLGIAPGLVGGLLARDIGAGFLGALAAGLIAGYACLLIKKTCQITKIGSIDCARLFSASSWYASYSSYYKLCRRNSVCRLE